MISLILPTTSLSLSSVSLPSTSVSHRSTGPFGASSSITAATTLYASSSSDMPRSVLTSRIAWCSQSS